MKCFSAHFAYPFEHHSNDMALLNCTEHSHAYKKISVSMSSSVLYIYSSKEGLKLYYTVFSITLYALVAMENQSSILKIKHVHVENISNSKYCAADFSFLQEFFNHQTNIFVSPISVNYNPFSLLDRLPN